MQLAIDAGNARSLLQRLAISAVKEVQLLINAGNDVVSPSVTVNVTSCAIVLSGKDANISILGSPSFVKEVQPPIDAGNA